MKEKSNLEPREVRAAALRAAGFTFAELLVGISLGAILVGTVLPALNTAQDTMKAAVCLGNMQQWGMAISLYTADQRDYYPYDGDYNVPPCSIGDSNAWFNVLPSYIHQTSLCNLYAANVPPRPGMKSIWICPSATNTTISISMNQAYFTYAFSTCLHEEGSIHNGFRRSRMVSPATTIIFCEEPEDSFPETNGEYDTVQRHFGGANFVMGDGHAEWLAFGNFCRAGNPGCPAPLGTIQWDDSSRGGDWRTGVVYHWWPFLYANTSTN